MIKTILTVMILIKSIYADLPMLNENDIHGKYLDELIFKNIGERQFELTQEFKYQDPMGVLWVVPKGTVVDGASIPRFFWTIIGAPLSGKYLMASVIHDYFFEKKIYNSESVHKVFYDAMITSGVNELKAKIMYFAVLSFNDAWRGYRTHDCLGQEKYKIGYSDIRCITQSPSFDIQFHLRRETVEFNQKEFEVYQAKINDRNPSLEKIRNMAKSIRTNSWNYILEE